MRSKNSLSRIMIATAGVAVAATVWGAGPAFAAGSTTVSPAGAGAQLKNIGNMTFTLGSFTATCTSFVATGAVPASPGNHNAAGPVTITSAPPTISGCTINAPFTGIQSITTSGTWAVSVQNGSPITGSLTIPTGGVVVKTNGLATCTVTVAPSGPTAINGTFTNGTNSTTNPSTITPNSGQTVPFTATGGGLCPTSGNASFNVTLGAYDTTNTATAITVGP